MNAPTFTEIGGCVIVDGDVVTDRVQIRVRATGIDIYHRVRVASDGGGPWPGPLINWARSS